MIGHEKLQRDKQKNWEPVITTQSQELEMININDPGELQEFIHQLDNKLASEYVQELPDYAHKNIDALNDYLKERENKGFTSNYAKYRKLAEKLTLNASKQGKKLKESEWKQLEDKAQAVLEKVKQEDTDQQKIRENATIQGLETTVDALLKDRNRVTDSFAYRALRKAAKAYKEEPDIVKKFELMKELKNQALSYAALRFKTTHKTEKGTRRMKRITDMLTMIDKVGEVEDLVCSIRKQEVKKTKVFEEIKENHLVDVNSTKNCELTAKSSRWAQAMQYYETDKDGNVTPETAAKYEENMEMMEAYKTNDLKRRKHVILKMYKRLNLPDSSNVEITVENAVKFYKKQFEGDVFQSNVNTMFDLLKTERETSPNDKELNYIYDRFATFFQSMNNIAIYNLALMGFGADGNMLNMSKSSSKAYRTQIDAVLEAAEKVKKGNTEYGKPDIPIDEEMERNIQNTIDTYQNSTAYREDCVPDSEEYIEKSIKMQIKSRDKLKVMQNDYTKKRYIKECSTSNPYWEQPERLAQLMLPEEIGEDGELVEILEYNDKMMKLLNSDDAEDRTAALASCYLRQYRGTLSRMELTKKGIGRFIRKQLGLKGFFTMYNTLDDYVRCEAERHSGNELVEYMYKNLKSARVANPNAISGYYYKNMGYVDADDNSIAEDALIGYKVGYEGALGMARDEYKKEKKENGGQYIQEDNTMIAKLKELCKKKGVLI